MEWSVAYVTILLLSLGVPHVIALLLGPYKPRLMAWASAHRYSLGAVVIAWLVGVCVHDWEGVQAACEEHGMPLAWILEYVHKAVNFLTGVFLFVVRSGVLISESASTLTNRFWVLAAVVAFTLFLSPFALIPTLLVASGASLYLSWANDWRGFCRSAVVQYGSLLAYFIAPAYEVYVTWFSAIAHNASIRETIKPIRFVVAGRPPVTTYVDRYTIGMPLLIVHAIASLLQLFGTIDTATFTFAVLGSRALAFPIREIVIQCYLRSNRARLLCPGNFAFQWLTVPALVILVLRYIGRV
jgi:hypothetical protein